MTPTVTGRRGGDDTGAVTAELALALPAVVLVLAVLLATATAASAQLRYADAARAGARVAALGQTDADVAEVARRVAGDEVGVRVHRDGTWVTVEVSADLPGSWFTGGRLRPTGRATAWQEP